MKDNQIRDYNELIKYVGEHCIFKNSKGKKDCFRKLNYKGYLGLSKNPKKKAFFDRKLEELMQRDPNFKVMLRKFNSRYGDKGFRIDNIDDFFEVGQNIMEVEPEVEDSLVEHETDDHINDSSRESVKEDVDTSKNNISFLKKIKRFFNNMPGWVKKANGISLAVFGGLVIIGGAPSLISLSAFIPLATATYYGTGAIYRSYKYGKLKKWLKVANKNTVKNKKGKVNSKENDIVLQPLPNIMENTTSEEVRTEKPILPQVEPPVARFSKPEKVEESGVYSDDDREVVDEEENTTVVEEKKDERIEEDKKENNDSVVSPTTLDNNSESEVKIGKHSKEGILINKKREFRIRIEQYLNGYGETVNEFARKYLLLLDSVNTKEGLEQLENDFKSDLKDVLHSEIEYQNWRKDIMGTSTQKEANEIRNDSQKKVQILNQELGRINQDKLETQKEYIEKIKAENLDNNYVKSLCEIVLGKIEEYYSQKNKLDSMDTNNPDYAMKKSETEKMYKNVCMYAFSVEEVLKQEIDKKSTRK